MKTVLLPHSLAELWRFWEDDPDARLYAGGTDLLVKMRSGLIQPKTLICLERLEELTGVSEEGHFIRIGSCTTLARLLENPAVQKHLPLLAQAVAILGSPLIRNMGTIGGNICTASPAGDTLPPLYSLDAELELSRKDGIRRLAIKDLLVGPGQTRLGQGEIVKAIWVPRADGYNLHHYEKVGQRNALSCSIASLAALIGVSSAGVVEKVRLAWGSVGPTIIASCEVEKTLIGEKLTMNTIQHAAALLRRTVSPISDVRADAEYRRVLAGNLLLRLLEFQ